MLPGPSLFLLGNKNVMQLKQHPLRFLSAFLSVPQYPLSSSCLGPAGCSAPPLRSFSAGKIPDRYALPSLLKASTLLSDVDHGRSIHAAAVRVGLQSEPYVASSLINMYAKCGHLGDAVQVFGELPVRDATTWNSMVDGLFRHGRRQEGLSCFLQMQFSGIRPDDYSLSILLGACSDYSELEHGRQTHAYLVKNITDPDPFLAATLIDMYAKCGRMREAQTLFDMTDEKNVYVWNAMIGGLSQMGLWEESLEFYASMKSQDAEVGSATFSSLLTACSYGEELGFGKIVHADVIKTGFELSPYVSTSLLCMYGKCASVGGAVKVFTGVPDKTTELYNAMIAAYTGNGFAEEALQVYVDMHCINARPDSFTVSNILASCALISLHDFGRTIHGQLIKRPGLSNFVMLSSLLTMYMKCENTEDACAVFNSILERDVVVWGSVITGLCQNKKVIDALELLRQMNMQGLRPDSEMMAAIAVACVRLEYIDLGCQIHGYAIKSGMVSDAFVGSVLIDMYAKSGMLESATKVFFNIPNGNLVLWNSLVAGFSRHGEIDSCLSTFIQMCYAGITPDSISITNLLVAASLSAALFKGKMIHGYQTRNGIKCDAHVDNALLDMYIKCGCLTCAQHIFERLPIRTTVSWNTMISGYGSHGHCHKAISLFEKMQKSEVAPDAITFLALITSCSHSGLTEGLNFFWLMTTKYGLLPTMEHYANVVDLLGRAGHINEAYHFINNMPLEGDASVWLSLLSACRAHGIIDIGEIAANHLLKLQMLEPEREDGVGHIQLWNLYGEGRLLEKAATVRVKMKKEGLKKKPGCSWVEVKDSVEVFYSGDSSSQLTIEIHDMLSSLRRNMRDEDISL